MTVKRREAFAILAGMTLFPALCSRADVGHSSGATNDNDGNDSDALGRIFAEMKRTGRGSLPSGTYKVTKPLVIPPGILEGGDVVLDFRDADPADFRTGVCVSVEGAARVKLPNLSRGLVTGERTLRFAGPHTLRVGETFQLSGTVDFAGNGYRHYYRKGEMFRVARVVDGSTLVVESGCRDSYPASDVEVWKRAGDRFTQGCDTLTVIGRDDIKYATQFAGLDGSSINNIRSVGGQFAALSITDCFGISGRNVRAHQTSAESPNPYGCVVGNSQDVRLNGECYGHFNGFTVGGGPTAGGKIGMNRDIHFEGTGGSHPTAGLSGGNIHGNAEYCSLRGNFANGVSMGGNWNEAHGQFVKAGSPPIVLAEMHGHDFTITGILRTNGDSDLTTKVGALHQSGYGDRARYGGVTEINLQMYAPRATRILLWRPSNLERTDVELRLSLDIMKAHPRTRIIALKKNGQGRALPLVTLDRINLVDNTIPIQWSVDNATRLKGPGVRAVVHHA